MEVKFIIYGHLYVDNEPVKQKTVSPCTNNGSPAARKPPGGEPRL